MPAATTLNTTPPSDSFLGSSGFGLRDVRSAHPVYDTGNGGTMAKYRTTPNVDDAGRLHYPDGTVVDPREEPHDPVTWDGLIMEESFRTEGAKDREVVVRTSYIPGSQTLIVDRFKKKSRGMRHDTLAEVSLPPERVADPAALVTAVHEAPEPEHAASLISDLVTSQASSDTLAHLAASTAFQTLLDS